MDITTVSTIESLCSNLETYFTSNQPNLLCVKKILENYIEYADKSDWNKHVKFSDNTYTRNCVYASKTSSFDVLVISWKENQKSKIHDHPERGCLMTVLDGELEENIYMRNNKDKDKDSDKDITFVASNKLVPNKIAYKESNTVLHQIIATCDTVSLHIYSPCGYVPHCF